MSSEITLDRLYQEITDTRKELKNLITAGEARLALKIETLNRKIQNLESENTVLKERIETLEQKNNKKNLVVFGIPNTGGKISEDFICEEIGRLLDVDVAKSDISDVYTLGKSDNSPVKLELVSYLKKKTILTNTKKLKNSNVVISNDLTPHQREIQKVLRVHLKRIRETSNKKCFIRGDRLIVDGTSYTLDRLDGLDFGGDSGIRRRSEPSTPTSTKHFGEVVADELLSQEVEQQAGDEITLNEGNAPNQPDDYVLAGGTKKLKALQPIKGEPGLRSNFVSPLIWIVCW
ncbi:hypothetical protein HHI36_019014 [Cryptolaemus montrouzieri]|uniref:Uncharacterized protein n=1 Tax=Cryptolaemus montrouzieri TaxID=559131 RepID=A0ABD2P2G1_9CUCU